MLVSDDSFWFGSSGISILETAKFGFIAISPFIIYLYKRKGITDSTTTMIVVLLCTFTFLSGVLNSGKVVSGSTLVLFLVLSAWMFAARVPYQRFTTCFSDIVLFLTIYSTGIYLLIVIGIINPQYIENVIGYNFATFGGMLYTFNGTIYRSSAFFREAGMWMIYINTSFLFDILSHRKLSIIRITLYLLGIVSSFSTGGIITFASLMLLYIFRTGNNRAFIAGVILAIAAVYLLFGYEDYMETVFGKLEEGTDNASTMNRYATMIVPFFIMLEHPLIGCGFENYSDIFFETARNTAHLMVFESASTNTIMSAGAIWGVWMAAFWLITLFIFSKKQTSSSIQTILIFVSLLMMFSNEVRFFSQLSYIIVFYGLKRFDKLNDSAVLPKKRTKSTPYLT